MSPFRRPASSDTAAAGDPIPFRIGDETHLFYLSSPAGTQDYPERVRTTWQHARSTDLVEWVPLGRVAERRLTNVAQSAVTLCARDDG